MFAPATGFAAVGVFAVTVAAQTTASRVDLSLDSLLNTRISTASKYSQTTAEAPASVTILTSDDIKQFGYRNLLEALEGVPGFYSSDDRNYSYLGTRGFGRPSDYNNRVLLLLDGQTLNEQVWGSAMVGSDFPINLDAIERIEVVRGPSSSLYGTNAMFAVVNIITKTGIQLDGVSLSGRMGSAGTRELGMMGGHSIGRRGSIAASGLVTHADGSDLFYPEYDAPATNFGIAHQADWEHAIGGMSSITWNGVTGRIGYRSRAKGIPTGAFETVFNDPSASTVDETLWGQIGGQRELSPTFRVSGRAYGDRYRYRGVYPADSSTADSDGARSTELGAEGLFIWEASSRNRLTMGLEVRRILHAMYYEQTPDGTRYRDDEPFSVASLFAENELQLFPRLSLVGGVRWDENSRGHDGFAPRFALVVAPDRSTTIKALYGQAYRAPSSAEADISARFYTRNPSLKPERNQTYELDIQRRIGSPLLLGVAMYEYRLRDLIDQVGVASTGAIEFENIDASRAAGIELQLDAMPSGPVSGRASYAFQRVETDASGEPLTNSPQQLARLAVTSKGLFGLRPAVEIRYESGRRTIAGASTPAFTRTDVNVAYTPSLLRDVRWLRGAETSLRVTNLFDVSYATPGGVEHRQNAIPQNGRAFVFRFDWQR
jgi:iron complex outermembrane receptor protein